jgi:hypothetical protein
MPRQPRLDAPGALHHVMGRGIDGVTIFRNRKDREDFLERLADLCSVGALRVYAWALMGNHICLESVNMKNVRYSIYSVIFSVIS